RRRHRRGLRRAATADRGGRAARKRRRRDAGGGGVMSDPHDAALLNGEVDDLLLQLRGLVLVRRLLAERGATRGELDAHSNELERVRARLADTIRGQAA